jgi:transcriptional regulator with XRE-family HTH domain
MIERVAKTNPERTLGSVVGANLKRLREERGMSQSEFAKLVRERSGLIGTFTRDAVASIETGRRATSIDEMLVFAWMLEVPVEDFFAGDGYCSVAQVSAARAQNKGFSLEAIRALLGGRSALESVMEKRRADFEELQRWREDPVAQARARRFSALLSEPTYTAAEKFGVSRKAVDRASQQLWGHSAEDEHWVRSDQRIPVDLSDMGYRATAAIRGHITRELLAELKPVLTKRGRR